MTVYTRSVTGNGGGGGFLSEKQAVVVPSRYEAEQSSQRLLDALSSGELSSASTCLDDPLIDVNFVGAVSVRLRKAEIVAAREEAPVEVRVGYADFKADVTALFLAVQIGNVDFVRRLLSMGADVNQKLFRGFATTAAVREGQHEILNILLKAGACEQACEEALLEASCHGRLRCVELLVDTALIQPRISVHAFVTACCRGFSDVVNILMKSGVDANVTDRVLLLSSKPSLHSNVDCTALAAAVVSRQVAVVHSLLQAGVNTNGKVKLGAWTWDVSSGEEIRVGAGLGDPYSLTWCAVEYFESTGSILQMLLKELPLNTPHHGRTLLHHAILCSNLGAVSVLLNNGADIESPVKTISNSKAEFRAIHLAARLGTLAILGHLIDAGCDINSRTGTGETALMICANHKRGECLRLLALAGADFGLVSHDGSSVISIARSNKWSLCFQQSVIGVIKEGKVPVSTNHHSVFSPLMFAAQIGDVEAIHTLIRRPWSEVDLDFQDERGFTAAMVAAREGHVEAFRLLVQAGTDVKLHNAEGETAITLAEISHKRDLLEKVLLEHVLEKDVDDSNSRAFSALHCAARRGDMEAARKLLTTKGYDDANIVDSEGHTPLMLAAKEGHRRVCELLIKHGGRVDAKNKWGETVLSFARKSNGGGEKGKSDVETLILDELARNLVLKGGRVLKHTKGGKGNLHEKTVQMVEGVGVLSWGKSNKRNVVCKEAIVGASEKFKENRRAENNGLRRSCVSEDGEGLFHVVTSQKKDVHFVVMGEGRGEAAEMWVRGIQLVTKDAILGSRRMRLN